MSQITKPHGDFVALTTAEAAKVNDQINTIYTDHNGGLTNFNINSVANIEQSKILNLVTDLATIRASRVTEVSHVSFTVSSGYTKPGDLLFARVICIGGGGAGGGAESTIGNASSGGGGGSGGYSESWLMASQIGASEFLTIGAAGIANGGNGGITSFGALVIANGGAGGAQFTDSIASGGGGGDIGTGQIIVSGCPGGTGFITTAPLGLGCGGQGGASGPYMVPGKATVTVGSAAGGAGIFGGGGAGGSTASANIAAGGNGGGGLVLITEFRA